MPLWILVDRQPIRRAGLDGAEKLFGASRLYCVTVSAEFRRAVHAGGFGDARKHDDGNARKLRNRLDLPKCLQPIEARHFDIQKDQARTRIRIRLFQKFQCRQAIAVFDDPVMAPTFADRIAHECAAIFIIVDQQDGHHI